MRQQRTCVDYPPNNKRRTQLGHGRIAKNVYSPGYYYFQIGVRRNTANPSGIRRYSERARPGFTTLKPNPHSNSYRTSGAPTMYWVDRELSSDRRFRPTVNMKWGLLPLANIRRRYFFKQIPTSGSDIKLRDQENYSIRGANSPYARAPTIVVEVALIFSPHR